MRANGLVSCRETELQVPFEHSKRAKRAHMHCREVLQLLGRSCKRQLKSPEIFRDEFHPTEHQQEYNL